MQTRALCLKDESNSFSTHFSVAGWSCDSAAVRLDHARDRCGHLLGHPAAHILFWVTPDLRNPQSRSEPHQSRNTVEVSVGCPVKGSTTGRDTSAAGP